MRTIAIITVFIAVEIGLFCQIASAALSASMSNKDMMEMKGGLDALGVLAYMRDGWQTIRDLVPGLRDPDVISNVSHAYNLGRLEYVKHSYGKLIERKVSCDACTPYYNITHYDTDITEEFGSFLFAHGLSFLQCCVNNHNANPATTRREVMPLLQVLNTHRFNPVLYELATSYRMAQVAAQLLQVPSVRLYQSAMFIKDDNELNQETVYHNDLNMIPLDTGPGNYLTFWCPIRRLEHAKGDSMLKFAHGSHRDMTLRHWYQPHLLYNTEEILARYGLGTPAYLDVGDCTVHSGWVMHAASIQPKSRPPRMALGFGFVASDATVMIANGNPLKIRNFPDEDEISYGPWLPDLKEGQVIDHPLLPIVYPRY